MSARTSAKRNVSQNLPVRTTPLSEEYNSCKQKYEEVFRQCNAKCADTCMDENYKSASVSKHI